MTIKDWFDSVIPTFLLGIGMIGALVKFFLEPKITRNTEFAREALEKGYDKLEDDFKKFAYRKIDGKNNKEIRIKLVDFRNLVQSERIEIYLDENIIFDLAKVLEKIDSVEFKKATRFLKSFSKQYMLVTNKFRKRCGRPVRTFGYRRVNKMYESTLKYRLELIWHTLKNFLKFFYLVYFVLYSLVIILKLLEKI